MKPFKSEKIIKSNPYPLNAFNTTFTQVPINENSNFLGSNIKETAFDDKKSMSSINNNRFIQEVDEYLL